MKIKVSFCVRAWVRAYFFLVAVQFIPLLAHAETPAGTLIQNQANVTYVMSAQNFSAPSNVYSFQVDELVDLTLTSDNSSGVQVQSPTTAAALTYTLTNVGNGSEAFTLSTNQLTTDNFDASNVKIYLDSNNDGIFESGTDTLYVPGTNDPVLSAAQSLRVFVVGDIPSSLPTGNQAIIQLKAAAKIGTGAPGTSFPGAGADGSTAVLGVHGGQTFAQNYFVTDTASATVTATQTILDPQNGDHPIQNAIITYTLTFVATGAGTLTNVVIADPIPAGTTYQLGSMKLDTLPLTDSADTDAGVFTGTGIQVSLGTVTAPTTHTVTFKVKIQ